eukprot:974566-Prymnesium_polylepis.1
MVSPREWERLHPDESVTRRVGSSERRRATDASTACCPHASLKTTHSTTDGLKRTLSTASAISRSNALVSSGQRGRLGSCSSSSSSSGSFGCRFHSGSPSAADVHVSAGGDGRSCHTSIPSRSQW